MRRRARGKEFRSNFHLNGTVEAADLPPEYEEIALSFKSFRVKYCRCRFIEGKNGPLVLEINSSLV